jgi:hypothetical protein
MKRLLIFLLSETDHGNRQKMTEVVHRLSEDKLATLSSELYQLSRLIKCALKEAAVPEANDVRDVIMSSATLGILDMINELGEDEAEYIINNVCQDDVKSMHQDISEIDEIFTNENSSRDSFYPPKAEFVSDEFWRYVILGTQDKQ